MTSEQQKILDRLWIDWDQVARKHRGLLEAAAMAERESLIAEAKFKGVAEAFGMTEQGFKWDGKHVQFLKSKAK